MQFGFDESGDFNFDSLGFDSACVAGVVGPGSVLAPLGKTLRGLAAGWGLEEIHAKQLDDGQLVEVCGVIGAGDVTWVAVYTDSRIFPTSQQLAWRTRQQTEAEAGIARAKTFRNDKQRQQQVYTMRGRMQHETRVGTPDYLEYMVLFPRVIGDAIQAAVSVFRDARWAPEFHKLIFESDAKLPQKTSAAEKTLDVALRYIMVGDRRFVLDVPAEWGPSHPFFASHASPTGGVSVPAVLGEGIRFVDSKTSAAVQLADVVASVVRRAVGNPQDALAQRCLGLMWRRRFANDGDGLRLFFDRQGPAPDPDHYAHLPGR